MFVNFTKLVKLTKNINLVKFTKFFCGMQDSLYICSIITK